MMDSEEQ